MNESSEPPPPPTNAQYDAHLLFDYYSSEYGIHLSQENSLWSFSFDGARVEHLQDTAMTLMESLAKQIAGGDPENTEGLNIRAALESTTDDSDELPWEDGQEVSEEDLAAFEDPVLVVEYSGMLDVAELVSIHEIFTKLAQELSLHYKGVEVYELMDEDSDFEDEGEDAYEDGDETDSYSDYLQASSAWELDDLNEEIARDFRARHLEILGNLDIQPAVWMPLAHERNLRILRPLDQIARRLMAAYAAHSWVNLPERTLTSNDLHRYVEVNQLRPWLSKPESFWLETPRNTAEKFAENSGSLNEHLWSLAWILGFEIAPFPFGEEADPEILAPIRKEILQDFGRNVGSLLQWSNPRRVEEVITLEDLLYCSHCALSGQAAEDAIAVIQERRHPLTWALSPGIVWDEIDLTV
jgi:hypothetical protein